MTLVDVLLVALLLAAAAALLWTVALPRPKGCRCSRCWRNIVARRPPSVALYGWLRKKLGCAHNAADVAHDTFLRILASRDSLLGMREPRAYLTTTAKRLVDRARRQLLEQVYLAELAVAAETMPGYPSPEETLVMLQALEQIGAALEHVSAKAREAFLLHYLDGQTHAAVAAHLGVSTKMIQKYLIQALLHCRQQPALQGA